MAGTREKWGVSFSKEKKEKNVKEESRE